MELRSMCNNFVEVDTEPEVISSKHKRKVIPVVLPLSTICEVTELEQEDYYKEVIRQKRMAVSSGAFEHEENHTQTSMHQRKTSKQIMRRLVRSGHSGLPRRQQTEEAPENEQRLLDHPEELETTSKPCFSKKWGWRMPRKGVKVWPSTRSCQRRSRARRVTKAMSPLRLLRTMRDAYVRVLTRLGNKCTPTWSSVGARGGF